MIQIPSGSAAFPNPRTLGIVTALSLERAVLPRECRWRSIASDAGIVMRRASLDELDLLCIRSGPGISSARKAAERLVSHGARALLCLGVSGGLAPGLNAADLVLAEAVSLAGCASLASLSLSRAWARQALPVVQDSALARTPRIKVRLGRVVSLERPVLSPARRADLWRSSMALAADLESAGVAEAAFKAGLPLLVLRAVCDASERDLSPELPRLLDEQGRVKPGRLLGGLVRNPALLADLLASQREFSAALESLRWALAALASTGNLLPGVNCAGTGPKLFIL